MKTRRDFFQALSIAGGAVAVSAVTKSALAGLPEPVLQSSAETMGQLFDDSDQSYNPVVTLNGWTLPWRMTDGVKEFHLVAEPVVR